MSGLDSIFLSMVPNQNLGGWEPPLSAEQVSSLIAKTCLPDTHQLCFSFVSSYLLLSV